VFRKNDSITRLPTDPKKLEEKRHLLLSVNHLREQDSGFRIALRSGQLCEKT
jgi:hypothetical protein